MKKIKSALKSCVICKKHACFVSEFVHQDGTKYEYWKSQCPAECEHNKVSGKRIVRGIVNKLLNCTSFKMSVCLKDHNHFCCCLTENRNLLTIELNQVKIGLC